MITHDESTCAEGLLADVVLEADGGPVLIVGGNRFATDAGRLRHLGRRALAVAAALEGIPDGPEEPVYERPFARVGMPRLPIEAGIPSDLMASDLSPATKLVWVQAWREVPHLVGHSIWRGRNARLAKTLHILPETVRQAWLDLEYGGWATALGRASRPSGYGENEFELHQQRRVDAPGAGTIEATAVDASHRSVKSDE